MGTEANVQREDVRADLRDAHETGLRHLATPGPRFDAQTRIEIALVARDAYLTAEPIAPWVNASDRPELTLAYRLARHASTITETWFFGIGLDPLAAAEVVGIVITIVPITALNRALGFAVPTLPPAVSGSPTGTYASNLEPATLNWLPVTAPADERAAVLQALSALPTEDENLWRLASAQYMSDKQMADPCFTRGTLSRAQMELVAGRLSKMRECFY
jgi:hypothetical protein